MKDLEAENFLCSPSLWILTKTKTLEAIRDKGNPEEGDAGGSAKRM